MDIKKIVRALRAILLSIFLLCCGSSAQAGSNYEKVLKKWTRSEEVFVLDNLEARLVWKATYLSDEFRQARRKFLTEHFQLSDKDIYERARDVAEAGQSVFLVSIYAGSSKWSDVGKDEGLWRMALETADGRIIPATVFERIPVTQFERETYPYVDQWSRFYRVSFEEEGPLVPPFRLKLLGMPAKSTLSW
jgi:hypothetical protein